jgi:hypothetical protein
MSLIPLSPKDSINKAFLRIKPDRETIATFKANLTRLMDHIDARKDEEFNKNLLIDFLKKSHYGDRYFINTKDKSDLVIHNDHQSSSTVGVIFEAKKPTKTASAEMPKVGNLNTKAVQQLVLYFMRERVTHKNVDVKHLIVTNVYEWFVFDATIFERLFFEDKEFKKKFSDFNDGRSSSKKTDFFYQQIAEPAIAKVINRLRFTHFDLRNYQNTDLPKSDLDILYKFLSPEHLLKLRFANDSNSLNKPFYHELLYIIGLTETKEKGKKLIGRMKEADRRDGSLIENAISRLDSLDKIARLTKPEEFGVTEEEQLFNVALRLSINWINRILFLKLLEAQLIKYHQGDRDFAFLNLEKVKNYEDLDSLFFDVLAKEQEKREAEIREAFAKVPYLNSSLFEPTETEQQTIVISNLKDRSLPIFGATVLKDGNGKKRSGELNALAYLFEFLDAYKFDKDESEDTQEDSEKLINAAVLGLIFEKINGYKDGSFYTPSFITMYMCRETIRRAVVEKFNEVKGWSCRSLDDLYEKIEDKKEANTIINSLKICDPAVGSGHFLVSALNEIIAIKSELRVLLDRSGKSLKDYRVEVRNDKLLVYDDEEKLFAYHPNNAEKRRVQEALFHEKQTIIEGCLFGVDINPNSVTICRLRLWIELLKNAYYKVDGNLETLPNIDINIKCGNSLISRFGLDVDVKQVLQKQKFSIEQYRDAVQTYRSAESKAQKREMEGLIAKIKAGFSSSLLAGDPKKVKLRQLQAELYGLENQTLLLEETKAEIKAREKRVNKLNNEIDKLSAEIEDIESGRLYENALEWRFEFPEVLNDDGDFVGFDIVIGNPPWGSKIESNQLQHIKSINSDIIVRMIDSFMFFINLTFSLKSKFGIICQIVPDVILYQVDNEKLRNKIFKKHQLEIAFNLGDSIFTDVARPSCIILITSNMSGFSFVGEYIAKDSEILSNNLLDRIETSFFEELPNKVITTKNIYGYKIINRIKGTKLIDLIDNDGIQRGVSPDFKDAFIVNDKIVQDFSLEKDFIFPTLTGGKDMKKYLVYDIGKKIIYTKKKDNPKLIPKIINYLNSFIDRITCVEVKEDKHPFWSLHRPRNSSIFTKKEKIIGVITGDKVIVALDTVQIFPTDGLYVMASNGDYSNQLIIGILNSKLSTYFYRLMSMETDRTLAQIKPTILNLLPIQMGNKLLEEQIEVLVEEILTAKKSDCHADTSELEQTIDQLVYKLYQLTYEEVKIIDPEFALTEPEYTAIKIG